MIDTDSFIRTLINKEYSHLCVVPCSFVKNLINASINFGNEIEYVPCASEAVACSVAAGLKIAGKKPIVIVQSSGLTNMGSCITSLLHPYDIHFPIIVSWRTYKEGDSEIQHKHLSRNLPKLIDSYGYKHVLINKDRIDIAIEQIEECEYSKQICLLEKETFSRVDLLSEHVLELSSYPNRSKYLEILNKKYKNKEVLFIGTTGNTAREMYSYMPNTNNFYMAGNMGGALSLGLGASKAGRKVIVCGGDAEFVMHMGGLTTLGRYSHDLDLTYILFDNESNKSTGGQNTYQSHLNYREIAKNSGLESNSELIKDASSFSNLIEVNDNSIGARLIVVKCNYDEETPRPPLEIVKRNKI
jgi:sulfopyruvate decarboxylase TPP-binding subunit